MVRSCVAGLTVVWGKKFSSIAEKSSFVFFNFCGHTDE